MNYIQNWVKTLKEDWFTCINESFVHLKEMTFVEVFNDSSCQIQTYFNWIGIQHNFQIHLNYVFNA